MPFSLLDKLRSIPFAFIDVETTGASTDYGDRVTEIGIVRVENGQRVAEYQQLVDPQRRIGAGVVALTGITQEMVEGQPLFADIRPRVAELMQGAVVVGHNVRFDLSFITGEFRRCRCCIVETLGRAHVMDTVRIARRMFGRGGNGLQKLAPRLGMQPTTAHRALADALTTHFVFERMLEPHGCWDLMLCDALVHQGGAMTLTPAKSESSMPLELVEALEQKTTVNMEYVDADGTRTERIIFPQQLRKLKGEIVLIAHCHLRDERRNFKLDRIVKLTKLEDFQPSPRAEEVSATDGAPMNTDGKKEAKPIPSVSVQIGAPSVANPPSQLQLFPRLCSRSAELRNDWLSRMGLDTVEILMEIEEQFGISIPDHVASNCFTVGDTHRVIVEMLVAKGAARSPDLEADAWQRLVRIVTVQMRMEPKDVRPESRWIPDITKYG